MPKKANGLAKSYSRKLAALEKTRARVELLFQQKRLAVDDIEQVYAGLFLEVFTEFEALIEDLFIGIFCGTHKSSLPNVSRIFSIRPAGKAREVVFEGKAYLDWLPFQEATLPRAKRFLKNGEPFSLIDDIEKGVIKKYHLLRNAVAHKSNSARMKFESAIPVSTLTPRERTPKGYLRTLPQGVTGLTQYQIAAAELRQIAVKLCQ